MTTQSPPQLDRRKPFKRNTIIWTLLGVLFVYVGSAIGYHLLQSSHKPTRNPDLESGRDTVVLLRLEQIRTFDGRVDVSVLIYPDKHLLHPETEIPTKDILVRLDSFTEGTELVYPRGNATNLDTTTLAVDGGPDNWPFDEYTTEKLKVTVFAGSGEDLHRIPFRIEYTGSIDGWNIDGGDAADQTSEAAEHFITFDLHRTDGSLAFDIGICLVLLALPAMALFVAFETVIGRKKYHPPLTTWFAAMLFAIVPLRNILPGAPPPGAWIDQLIVLWVLIALVFAMVLYVAAWWRQAE